jgi:hypothetical protein
LKHLGAETTSPPFELERLEDQAGGLIGITPF